MSKPARRFIRTMLIGTFALGALLWMAVRQFDVSPRELFDLLLTAAVLVGLVIAVSGGAALAWIALRKFFRRRGGG